MMPNTVLLILGNDCPKQRRSWWRQFTTVVAPQALASRLRNLGLHFVDLAELVDSENVKEASLLAEEISRVTLPNGSRLAKIVTYRGYELWWIYYQNIFLYFALPYTKYRRLLEFLRGFDRVLAPSFSYKGLFECYLRAHEREFLLVDGSGFRNRRLPSLGIFLQIFITLGSWALLLIKRPRLMIFIGDKFEKGRDYDFRMGLVYQELRQRRLVFVEFVRSLESWSSVLRHAWIRRRPVIYSEAVAFVGRFIGFIGGARRRASWQFRIKSWQVKVSPDQRFRLLVAARPLVALDGDIWASRIMGLIMRSIGVRAGFLTAANERNFHTVLGCKLKSIPTVGIMHSASPKDYTVYDFLPGFDGDKSLSVDRYGLWSEWWRDYYCRYSRAYKPEQLIVAGPMRPVNYSSGNPAPANGRRPEQVRVLFISEQLAEPQETLPYLEKLMEEPSFDLMMKFRPYRDGFEQWLRAHRPELLRSPKIKTLKGGVPEAVAQADVVVGSNSTAVLEALLQLKVPIFFRTQKWGDYFGIRDGEDTSLFFAEDPGELIEKIKRAALTPPGQIKDLQKRYFGDPYQNGSQWVVDRLEAMVFSSSPLVK